VFIPPFRPKSIYFFTGLRNSTIHLNISIYHFRQFLYLDKAHEKGKKDVKGFGGKARKKETTWKTEA
jgi:hypothetical protein